MKQVIITLDNCIFRVTNPIIEKGINMKHSELIKFKSQFDDAIRLHRMAKFYGSYSESNIDQIKTLNGQHPGDFYGNTIAI
jgi:hypothetical protein